MSIPSHIPWPIRFNRRQGLVLAIALIIETHEFHASARAPATSPQPGTSSSDASYPDIKLERIAFGSCHSRGALDRRLSALEEDAKSSSNRDSENEESSRKQQRHDGTIWDAISEKIQPQTFLWTGDAIYPPTKIKGDTPLEVMKIEYDQMLHNETLGYAKFIHNRNDDDNNHVLEGGIHGVWDDHDYGGNDRGRELPNREGRRDAYLEFLGVSRNNNDPRWERDGLYSSIEFGSNIHHDDSGDYNAFENNQQTKRNNQVKVIFLDTRWHRDRHCIPSIGSTRIPLGSVVSCATRWITAGVNLPNLLPSWLGILSSSLCPNDGAILGEEQWTWLEQQLQHSSAAVHVVISSIQVLTTNPVVESWGHFPEERSRLMRILSGVKGLVLLSGDVHHAEIATTRTKNPMTKQRDKDVAANVGAIVEVTSSGMTHSCEGPFYGRLCRPILDSFPKHRFVGGSLVDRGAPSYFTQRNFGSIDLDWTLRKFTVNVHDDEGNVVLTTAFLEMDIAADLTEDELDGIAKCIDGHFLSFLHRSGLMTALMLSAIGYVGFILLKKTKIKPKKQKRQ